MCEGCWLKFSQLFKLLHRCLRSQQMPFKELKNLVVHSSGIKLNFWDTTSGEKNESWAARQSNRGFEKMKDCSIFSFFVTKTIPETCDTWNHWKVGYSPKEGVSSIMHRQSSIIIHQRASRSLLHCWKECTVDFLPFNRHLNSGQASGTQYPRSSSHTPDLKCWKLPEASSMLDCVQKRPLAGWLHTVEHWGAL